MIKHERRSTLNSQWCFWLLVVAVGLTGVWFRLWQLPLQLLADDEWHALNKLLKSDAWGIFTSFGHADHSIPLTLYYYCLSLFTPLTENIMRTPMVLAGLALPFAVPRLMQSILSRPEQTFVFILLALSPILIYYTRTARPYAISTLLGFTAIILFYFWTQTPKWRYALSYLLLCSLCAWMQPVTLAFLLTPFLFFGIKSVYCWQQRGDNRLFLCLLTLGIAQLVALIALLGPPIYFSLKDISGKAGVDSPTLHSVLETFKLLTGSEFTIFTLAFMLLTIWGAIALGKRHKELACYLATCTALSLGAILLSGAAWIQHPLVTARYCLPILPVLAIFTAVGLSQALRFTMQSNWLRAICFVIVSLTVVISGPLMQTYSGPINQFTGHMSYQFDYDWESNTYNEVLNNRSISPFYQQLGSKPAKSLLIIIAPWLLEWHWNRWYIDQAVHNQIISAGFVEGLCGNSFYGEYKPENQQVDLENVVHISKLDLQSTQYNYFIYHKVPSRDEQNISKYKKCEDSVRREFGKPDYEDRELIAYKLPKNTPL